MLPRILWLKYIINIIMRLLAIYIYWNWLMHGRCSILKYTHIHIYICIYMYVYIYIYIYMPMPTSYIPASPPTHLRIIHSFIHLHLSEYTHQPNHPSTYPSIHPSTHPPIHPPTDTPTYLYRCKLNFAHFVKHQKAVFYFVLSKTRFILYRSLKLG